MVNPVNHFRTLQLLRCTTANPDGVIVASVNTQRSLKMDFQSGEYYVPDPSNPGKPVPRRVNVTGYGATMDISGVASADDIADLVNDAKGGEGDDYKLLDLETNTVTAAMNMKITGLTWTSDPSKGEPATFDGTLSTDGEFTFTPAT